MKTNNIYAIEEAFGVMPRASFSSYWVFCLLRVVAMSRGRKETGTEPRSGTLKDLRL